VGYRVTTGPGHHKISFECLGLAMGKPAGPYADYFDWCRRKRNVIDYDEAYVSTETETEEIVRKTKEFLAMVEHWIAKSHPGWKA
jgi:hypothetical protein